VTIRGIIVGLLSLDIWYCRFIIESLIIVIVFAAVLSIKIIVFCFEYWCCCMW